MGLFDELDGAFSGGIQEKNIKAPFRYPGCKSKSYEKIIDHTPMRRNYVEVFGGTGIVLLNKPRSTFEVFNDINRGITSFYICLQSDILRPRFAKRLKETIWSRDYFEWCKETWSYNTEDRVEVAIRWYYMLMLSFGALGRNFGITKDGAINLHNNLINKTKHFYDINERLRGVLIENRDWKKIIETYDSPETVFYIDPPYTNTDNGTYHNVSWSDKDHHELLGYIAGCDASVVVSCYDSPLYASQNFWTDERSWDVYSTMNPVNADGNNRNDHSSRSKVKEKLYVKET